MQGIQEVYSGLPGATTPLVVAKSQQLRSCRERPELPLIRLTKEVLPDLLRIASLIDFSSRASSPMINVGQRLEHKQVLCHHNNIADTLPFA
jgi:hypothetical protein